MRQKLLLATALLFTTGAFAQSQSVIFTGRHANQPVEDRATVKPDHSFMRADEGTANKTTTGQTKRWYSYFETLDNYVLNGALSSNYRIIPIWQDSTVRQRFTNIGLSRINYSSVYQVIDPISFIYFNSKNAYPGAVQVRSGDSYTIDSIWIDGFYQRLSNKANIVDTLLLTVTAPGFSYYDTKANSSWVASYLPNNQDTIWGPAPTDIDSVNRVPRVTGTENPGVSWKVPLYYADSSSGKAYMFKVGGPNGSPVTIPAGRRLAISCTFKSGDTWVRNVDSFNMHNNFRPFTATTADNTQMPYYWYQYADHNMSGLMFSFDPREYSPSVFIEGYNSPAFAYEFHSMGAKVTCTSCRNVGVPGAMELISSASIYPNPATNSVSVPVSMKADAKVTVRITNTMGQVLMSQDLGKVAGGASATATFSVSELPTGMYFYTVEANGRRVTDRFNVAH